MEYFTVVIIALGFCILIGFEIRIVTYLKRMRDLLQELVKK
jgi:hypothetical protein